MLCHTGPEKTIEPLREWPSFSAPDVSVYAQLSGEPESEFGVSMAPETGSEVGEECRVAQDTGGDTP